jgi:ketosteroid isomerase-like protein
MVTRASCSDPRAERVVRLFEALQAGDVARLGDYYAAHARFKDPFNDVRSLAAIQRIFAHMFSALKTPRFVILESICEGSQCFLTWDFQFVTGQRSMRIHGSSHLQFDADGLICLHRDYWDAAEELYEQLPVLGSLMRWLKRRAGG